MWMSVFKTVNREFLYDSYTIDDCELRVKTLGNSSYMYQFYVSGVQEHYEEFMANDMFEARIKAVSLLKLYVKDKVSYWCRIEANITHVK